MGCTKIASGLPTPDLTSHNHRGSSAISDTFIIYMFFFMIYLLTDSITKETVLPNIAYVEMAPCPCDLIQNRCESDCCCDTVSKK